MLDIRDMIGEWKSTPWNLGICYGAVAQNGKLSGILGKGNFPKINFWPISIDMIAKVVLRRKYRISTDGIDGGDSLKRLNDEVPDRGFMRGLPLQNFQRSTCCMLLLEEIQIKGRRLDGDPCTAKPQPHSVASETGERVGT